VHGSDQEARYGVLPQVEKAWNFPLFEAIVGRRSRRFGFGMELSHGPFSYKSDKEPVPLDEAETAMLTRPPDKQCAGSQDTRAQKIVTQ